METEFHLKFFSAGPNYWLGQLNLGGIIAHIILLWMKSFLSKSLLQLNWVYNVTQKLAQSHFRVIVTTQNSLRLTRTQG